MEGNTASTPAPEPISTSPGKSASSRQKSQALQCRYCPSSFRRLEHFQRHERIHTKEKPFVCEHCGKKFSRKDILLRHGKLVHSGDLDRSSARMDGSSAGSASTNIPRGLLPDLSFNNQTTASSMEISSQYPTPRAHSISESLSDAAHQLLPHENLATGLPHQPLGILQNHSGGLNYYDDIASHPETDFNHPLYQLPGPGATPEDYNLFLDHFDLTNLYLPSSVFDSGLPTSLWCRPDAELVLESQNRNRLCQPSHEEQNSLSRFGSRLPSLQPEDQDPIENEPLPRPYHVRADPPWKISGSDHREIKLSLEEFADVLPSGFVLPSRHALSQFFEGYISGFHQHLPFLHIPTLVASKCFPELLLAIVAVGAQYRFESNKGNNLWYAARAIAFEQTRRRQSRKVAAILSSPTPRPTTYASSSAANQGELGSSGHSTSGGSQHDETTQDFYDPRTPIAQARLRTIQSLLILMAMGMWGPQVLLREATSLQNQLALLIREQGLQSLEDHEDTLAWEDWILVEGDRRTKFLAYCFFNLHSIAYNTPPLLLASEMKMKLPQSSREWHAENSRQWHTIRRTAPQDNMSFHFILSKLFDADQADHPPISSLGNYVLIHAIIQQIFFVRQTFVMANPIAQDSRLQPEDIQKFEQILRSYQIGWERSPESSLDPANPYGPVAFSSTALLRLAYIRLHCDIGPCRRLDTRDPQLTARALKASPPLLRSPLLSRAVLQSAHALSIPVKIGIKYVAHTQTLMWSMQHSLCNLECAVFLSKWLTMISCSLADLTSDEWNLLQMVRSILNETDFAVAFDGSIPAEESVKELGTAVVRLWAETFSGSHHVFPLVRDIGAALVISVDLLEENDMA